MSLDIFLVGALFGSVVFLYITKDKGPDENRIVVELSGLIALISACSLVVNIILNVGKWLCLLSFR